MIGLCLWRLWKWILHLLTGHCELYRIISLSNTPVHQKTSNIVKSLKVSRLQVLRDVVKQLGLDLDVPGAVQTIIAEKSIKPAFQQQFTEQITPCLVRISGVRQLLVKVEDIRAEPYQQTDKLHEEALMQLWSQLMVGCELTSRISKQWQDIGFQGDNPATDFRGMGSLGLQCLLYFSTQHSDIARNVLLHSKHPQHWYPWAVVGIDLTGEVYTWLKEGTLDTYLYSTCTHWPPPVPDFMEIFCYVFWKFDSFWIAEKPENIMAFPAVKTRFVEQFKLQLDSDNGNIILCLKQ